MERFDARLTPDIKVSAVVSLGHKELDSLRTLPDDAKEETLKWVGNYVVLIGRAECPKKLECGMSCSVAMLEEHGVISSPSAAQVTVRCSGCAETQPIDSTAELIANSIRSLTEESWWNTLPN